MQNADQAERAADETRIPRQLLGGFRRSAKEHIIHELLVTARERAELAGQREGDQEVGHGQLQFVLLLEPTLGVLVLALGAMTVATRVILVDGLVAVRAGVDVPTQGGRAAAFNRAHGPEVARQHLVTKPGAIGWPASAKNVSEFGHSKGCITRLIASVASAFASRVRWV